MDCDPAQSIAAWSIAGFGPFGATEYYVSKRKSASGSASALFTPLLPWISHGIR